MKKIILISTFVYVFGSLPAFSQSLQLPAQQSANIIKFVIKSILDDQALRFYTISKITVSDSSAKAQLLKVDGECLAIPYAIKINYLGEITVQVDTAALAICD